MRYVVLGLVCCALHGCLILEEATASRMNDIEVGMSREQVRKSLGSPASKGADSTSETWYYQLYDSERDSLRGIPTTYFVRIVENRVEAFGRWNEPSTEERRVLQAQSCPSPPPAPPTPSCTCPPQLPCPSPPPCTCPATH